MNVTRFRIALKTPHGLLWLSRPSQAGPLLRISASDFTSVERDAYQFATEESAHAWLEGVATRYDPVVLPVDTMTKGVPDPYVVSTDPVVPHIIVEETSRSTNPKTGKTRIKYRGVL